MAETAIGKAWEAQHRVGMSSKEAQAFKRGWVAARAQITEALSMLDDPQDWRRVVTARVILREAQAMTELRVNND